MMAPRSPRLDTGPPGTELHGHKLEMNGHTLRLRSFNRGDPADRNAVVGDSFGRAAYRLSLLALVGDGHGGARRAGAEVARACPSRLPCPMARRPIGRDEVAELSAGRLAPLDARGKGVATGAEK